jgi:hypothetical protein
MRALSAAVCGILVAMSCGSVASFAADAEEIPCLKEVQRLCPIVPVGLEQACLQAHANELSAECRKRVSQVNADIDRLGRDCGSDADRLCTQPQTAGGQRAACLLEHRDALSPACRKALDAVSVK